MNFTSGSTGKPKGVLVCHAGVIRLVQNPNYVHLDRSSRLLQLAPLSFDAATFEIWSALLNGGSLVLMQPGPVSVEDIGQVLNATAVNTLWLTAGLFDEIVDTALPALRGVRYLLAGGDVVSPERVKRVMQAHPACQVINGYGPTENTTFSCCYPVPSEADLNAGVPIGRPINNTRVYVLDATLRPVAVGVVGELRVRFPLSLGVGLVVDQSRGGPGSVVCLTVDPGCVQASKVLFRGKNAGVAQQVPQHQQRVGLG